MSLALWGSPDKCLWLCPDDYRRWEGAYKAQAEEMLDPQPGTIIRLVEWEVWLKEEDQRDFEQRGYSA